MLVLTRTAYEGKNEIICTTPDGAEIRFKILENHKGRIKIGVEASKDVRILRGEVEPIDDERGNK